MKGFALVTALLLVLLMAALGLFLDYQLLEQWRMSENVQSQLYSQVLAENGVEYARSILPHLELNALLRGMDDTHSGSARPEWRNPVPFAQARDSDPALIDLSPDDGLPFHNGQPLLSQGYRAEGGGYFFLRFSNNPEEPPDQDTDRVVLVRSMGIVPARIRDGSLAKAANDIALVEARFRQEAAFLLPSPLTLFADSGNFSWEGDQFVIDGTDRIGISVVNFSQAGLEQAVVASLATTQKERIRGANIVPSSQNATDLYATEATYRGLYRSNFWNHFEAQLPKFADGPTGGLHFLPSGGVLDEPFAGVLVSRGDLTLRDSARLDGLLLHLGGGRLTLEAGTRIRGGVWMSNLDPSGSALHSYPLALRVGHAVEIIYDAAAVQRALGCFPPTQLGWRILFPEMVQ